MRYMIPLSFIILMLISGCGPLAVLPENGPDTVAEVVPAPKISGPDMSELWSLKEKWTLRWGSGSWYDLTIGGDAGATLFVACITSDGKPFFIPVSSNLSQNSFESYILDGPNPPMMYHYIWNKKGVEPPHGRDMYVFAGPLGPEVSDAADR